MYEASGAGGLGSLIVLIIVTVFSLLILFVIIRTAVVQGMNAHFKTVRRYQATGEWRYSTDGKSEPLDLSDGSSNH